MTAKLPSLCPRCHLPFPQGHTDPCCPRCGADPAVPEPPLTWLSSTVAGLCGFLAGAQAAYLLAAWLLPPGLPAAPVRAGGLALAVLIAALMAWLSRHLVPSAIPGLFRAAVAMLAAGILVALFNRNTGHLVADPGGYRIPPDFLLACQLGLTGLVYVLLRVVSR